MDKIDTRVLQLEIDSEHAKRDIDELRDIVIMLSHTISDMDKKITALTNEK